MRRYAHAAPLLACACLALLLSAAVLYHLRPTRRAAITPTPTNFRINVNTADAAALSALPDIGPALADAIIAHRAVHGPFHSPDDLAAVKGIGPKRLATLRNLITCSHP